MRSQRVLCKHCFRQGTAEQLAFRINVVPDENAQCRRVQHNMEATVNYTEAAQSMSLHATLT